MGFGSDPKWLQNGIFTQATISGHQRNYCSKRSRGFYSKRNRQSFMQKCNRKSAQKTCNDRFLQYTFSGAKEKWGNAPSDKLATSQQVSGKKAFQNGHNNKSDSNSRKRRLVNNTGSVRCILPSQDFQTSSKISPVQFSGQSVPVSSPKFWSNSSTTSFHKSHLSGSRLFKKAKYKACYIPRRLACPESNQKNAVAESVCRTQPSFSTRVHNKQSQIKFSTKSESNIYRRSFRVSKGSGISNTRTCTRTEKSSPRSVTGSKFSTQLSCSVGKDSLLFGTNSECQIIHASNSAASVEKLEPKKNGYEMSNPCYTFAQTTFELVATGSKYFKGSICTVNKVYSNSDNRCEPVWLGWSHEQSDSARPLVQLAENVSHQLSGDGGSFSDSETFSVEPFREKCFDSVRQSNSYSVSEPPGRNQVIGSVPSNMATMVNGTGEQYLPQSDSYSREEKFFGGLFEQTLYQRDGMVPEQSSCSQSFLSVGLPSDGFVCNISEQENSAVLLMDSSSTGVCHRCNVNFLAEHVCLCIPSNTDDPQGVAAYETVSLQDNSHSTILAEAVLVSATSGNGNSFSTNAATLEESVDASERTDFTPRSTVSETDGMAAVDRHFSEKGFSERTRKLLASSWRKGTRKDITQSLNSSVAGVLNGTSIPFMPL